MPFPYPMRLIDPSGRSLHWVMFLEGTDWHTKQSSYQSNACLIELCPRPSKGQPQDILSRPCHSEGSNFFQLKEEMHQWLEEQDSYYQLEFRYTHNKLGWCAGFIEAKQAVMFKLRYGV